MNEKQTPARIDRRKHYFLVVDIETANFTNLPIAYDIGYAVADRKGNIYASGSLMIAEMFLNYPDLMSSAFYASKIPQYWKDFTEGNREIVSILTAYKRIYRLMKLYNISEVYAYNARFDSAGLDNTLRYLTKSEKRWFFPYGTKVYCIQHMAVQTILSQKNYFKFALENGLVTDKGNLSTSAESAYRYISKNEDFAESHTGFEDVQIELQILVKCFNQHKKIDKRINPAAWSIPQKAFRTYKEAIENS